MQLGIIGGGAMAEAIVSGLLAGGAFAPEAITVAEPQSTRRTLLAERYGVSVTEDNRRVAAAPTLLLAIKPQALAEVVAGLSGAVESSLIVSILAGVPLATLVRHFPGRAVVRAMPNTPALVRAGITALSRSPEVDATLFGSAVRLFEAVGEVVEVAESLMDAVTGLSGSGPGYLAVLIEALIDGGVAVGLPRPTATRLAIATVRGSAELLLSENLHPAVLKDRVTSPGGTTIAGIAELESHAVRAALIAAVRAATARSRELGRE